MVQRGDRFSLARESCPELGVARQLRRENLHRYGAIQARVARPIHLAHPPSTDVGQDFVWAEARARL
jgi:hypothetical protein